MFFQLLSSLAPPAAAVQRLSAEITTFTAMKEIRTIRKQTNTPSDSQPGLLRLIIFPRPKISINTCGTNTTNTIRHHNLFMFPSHAATTPPVDHRNSLLNAQRGPTKHNQAKNSLWSWIAPPILTRCFFVSASKCLFSRFIEFNWLAAILQIFVMCGAKDSL